MQIYIITACIAISVSLTVLFVGQLMPGRPAGIARGLAELEEGELGPAEALQRRRRARAAYLRELLEVWGEHVAKRQANASATRQQLVQAGFMGPTALPIFWGVRLTALAGGGMLGLASLPVVTSSFFAVVVGAAWLAVLGWILPAFYVGRLVRARQKAIILSLPDALDMMVVCVEAGLALNQAIMRVAQEIGHVSPVMAEQLELVNLEIRAGTGREDALRNLAERTGVPDMRSFVTMLIQTDRFGTSIAQALRIHADTMRTKRRQRAEEAAAKTTIKLVFPLVFFVFPAMFAVILAPALIQIFRTLAGMR